MVIQHNRMSQNAGRQLHSVTAGKEKLTEKLSSGFQINRAADDAAGLTISESLRQQIRGLNRASQNAEDGISLIQTAEGGLEEVHSILKRMRELSVQAANDTNTEEDRNAIQFEIDDLVEEVDRIADTTQYNTMNLLDGNLEGPQGIRAAGARGNGLLGEELNSAWARANAKLGDFASGNIKNYMADDISNFMRVKETEESLVGGGIMGEFLNITISDMSIFIISEDIKSALKSLYDGNGGSFNGKGDEAVKCLTKGFEKMFLALGQPGVIATDLPQYMDAKAKLQAFNSEANPANMKAKLADFSNAMKALAEECDKKTKYWNKEQGAVVRGMKNMADSFTALLDNPAGVSLGSLTGALNTFEADRKVYIKDGAMFNLNEVDGITTKDQMLAHFQTMQGYRLNVIGRNGNGGGGAADGPRGALMLQAGAQAGQGIGISIESVKSDNLGLTGLRVTSHPLASQAITTCDQAIERVSGTRSRLGALQNRLEHTVSTLRNTGENTQMAESRIRDTDMAKTMSEYARANILSQAGQAVLAQANSSQEGILSLL